MARSPQSCFPSSREGSHQLGLEKPGLGVWAGKARCRAAVPVRREVSAPQEGTRGMCGLVTLSGVVTSVGHGSLCTGKLQKSVVLRRNANLRGPQG